mgnify:CR=1 FL=1
MAKQVYECNWAPSRVTEEQLKNLVKTGALAKKDVIHWRVPGPENPPTPKDGEVVVKLNRPMVFKVCKRRKKQVSHLAMVISDLPRVGKTKYILT